MCRWCAGEVVLELLLRARTVRSILPSFSVQRVVCEITGAGARCALLLSECACVTDIHGGEYRLELTQSLMPLNVGSMILNDN